MLLPGVLQREVRHVDCCNRRGVPGIFFDDVEIGTNGLLGVARSLEKACFSQKCVRVEDPLQQGGLDHQRDER